MIMKTVNLMGISRNDIRHWMLCLGTLLILSTSVMAQGDLLIFPKRIVFENGKKAQVINLSNMGKDTATYNISFVQIRMNENGTFDNITSPDSGQLFADTFLRFFPRTVTLAPNESQVVKIQLTRTDKLTQGEYRSHLYFRAVPRAMAASRNQIQKDTSSISVHLVPVFGITIATIVRIGESTTKVSLSNVSLEQKSNQAPTVHMDFTRTGNMSVYGDIVVTYISPKGKSTQVGEIRGIAVYTPGTLRRCNMELKQIDGIDYSTGKLKITYSAQADARGITLAEAELELPSLTGIK